MRWQSGEFRCVDAGVQENRDAKLIRRLNASLDRTWYGAYQFIELDERISKGDVLAMLRLESGEYSLSSISISSIVQIEFTHDGAEVFNVCCLVFS